MALPQRREPAKLTKIQSLDETKMSPSTQRRQHRLTPEAKQMSESELPRSMTRSIAGLSRDELVVRCEQYRRRCQQLAKDARAYQDENTRLTAEVAQLKEENERLLNYVGRIQELLDELTKSDD